MLIDREKMVSRIGLDPMERIFMMENHDGAYDVWKQAGVQDQILVHFGGHLGFAWIAEHSPQQLLSARSSVELDKLLSQVDEWNWEEKSLRELVNMVNFIYPAIKEERVKSFY
jgi:hypothetical protein